MQDKWQIPDPPLLNDDGSARDDAMLRDELELVLLPGVAFDRNGGRLGHGKGYYGEEGASWCGLASVAYC
jgi:5-formyltetrahydrofolate cyclo-ligase